MMLVQVVTSFAFTLLVRSANGNNIDRFNYDNQNQPLFGGTEYAQQNWGSVTCDRVGQCDGYPNYFEFGNGFSVDDDGNNCDYCPDDGSPKTCGLHRQSPIDLKRDRGFTGNPNEKECPDWHWMAYRPDSCTWDDMATKDTFQIERHALQINIPTLPNGDIDCTRNSDGARRWPRLDYSKGFPDWWWMSRMDVSVPSQHHQEGKQYAAEVTLAHFYEVEHPKNQLGHVTLMMQDYPDTESWPYLDKLICAWRVKEEQVRVSCGLPPATPYGRCKLYRNQEPTEEWLEEAGLREPAPADPTSTPSTSPVTSSPSKAPVTASTLTSTPSKAPVTSGPSSTPTLAPVTTALVTASPVTSGPTSMLTTSPTKAPTDSPSGAPIAPTGAPVPLLTISPTDAPVTVARIPDIECGDYRVNYNRMCFSSDPCCESTRADTTFCWDIYDNAFPGDLIYAACNKCCDNVDDPFAVPKEVGDPNPVRADLPQTLQCSDIDNPFRLCKPNSCCSGGSDSSFCLEREALYTLQYGPDAMDEVCWYCCREPQILPQRRGRNLRSNFTVDTVQFAIASETFDTPPVDSKIVYLQGKKIILRPENFEEEEEDDDEYFERIHSDYRRRAQEVVIHEEDYEDVSYWPYEWMLKVDTEYYYRYEGTQVVPPCWEVVHWRVMKDPIRVHARQIAELNRLLATRHDPVTCLEDTAGVVSPDGQTVNASRDVSYYHPQHRKVFCECKDWPSKFDSDRQWCDGWKNDLEFKRFYETPYNFDTNGEF